MSDPTKKRSRRLHKKLPLGKCQKFGFPLTFCPQQTDFDETLDRCLESQGRGVGGGDALPDLEISGYLCLVAGGSLAEADRELMRLLRCARQPTIRNTGGWL
ncbi:50S ribosome-binding protein YggL [Aeromonas hydrophila]